MSSAGPATRLGRPRVHFRITGSTNERARELAHGGAPHGTLVTAGEQHAGRGRQGRVWAAPPGRALLCSIVLRELTPLTSLAAAVAVRDAAVPLVPDPDAVRIKWPNDVLLGGRKLSGILVEGRPQEGWAVLGIGVNVAIDPAELPDDVRAIAASLAQPADAVEPFLQALLAALDRRLAALAEEILAELRAHDALRGREVTHAGGTGIADGIDDQGRLIVRSSDGSLTAVGAGEVHIGTAPA